MFRSLNRVLILIALLAGGTLLAAPVPGETRKPAAFPAAHYVLAGAGEPAQGDDVYEFMKTFRLRPGQFVLSGGSKPTDYIAVDDDLELYQDGKSLFIDDDRVRSANVRGKQASRYQGQPIVLVLDPAKKLRVVAVDHQATDAIVGQLWLHRWDGARKRLTEGKQQASVAALPSTFFDESFTLTDGFEMPEKVNTDAATELPEKPATLLPRFKPKPAPEQPVSAVSAPAVSDFVFDAVTCGLTEDGVPPALAAQLARRDDFLPKCGICTPTRKALADYGKLKGIPTAKEGKGLPGEVVKRLKSDDNQTRHLALRELVQRYIEREYAKRDLTAEQRTALQKDLEQIRTNVMGGLRGDQKFCPSCDGACRRTPRL
jgi:hypothetical protein